MLPRPTCWIDPAAGALHKSEPTNSRDDSPDQRGALADDNDGEVGELPAGDEGKEQEEMAEAGDGDDEDGG